MVRDPKKITTTVVLEFSPEGYEAYRRVRDIRTTMHRQTVEHGARITQDFVMEKLFMDIDATINNNGNLKAAAMRPVSVTRPAKLKRTA